MDLWKINGLGAGIKFYLLILVSEVVLSFLLCLSPYLTC